MVRVVVLAAAAATMLLGTAAAAQTRYFDGTPTPEDLERALTPQAVPPAAATQPPMRGSESGRRAPPAGRAPPPQPPKVGLTVNFAFNSAELSPEARRVLDVLAIAINRLPQFRFQIEGHTDAVGGDAFNLTLSQRRAAAVVQYLVLTHNVSPARLAAIGFGERKLRDPLNPNDGINRRVEVMNLGPA